MLALAEKYRNQRRWWGFSARSSAVDRQLLHIATRWVVFVACEPRLSDGTQLHPGPSRGCKELRKATMFSFSGKLARARMRCSTSTRITMYF